jgi:hypothetical protein
VRDGDMFRFLPGNETVESGSRVLSKINTTYLFWLATRDHAVANYKPDGHEV